MSSWLSPSTGVINNLGEVGLGEYEAIGLRGVGTSQLWSQGCGQEALRVPSGLRHPYLSLSLVSPVSFCLYKIRACGCSQAQGVGKGQPPPTCCESAQHSRSGPIQSLYSPLKGSATSGVTPGPFGGNGFPTIVRCLEDYSVLPHSCYPILHHHNGQRCSWSLQTRTPQLLALWREPPPCGKQPGHLLNY